MKRPPDVRHRTTAPTREGAAVVLAILLVAFLHVSLLATRVGPLDGLWSIDQGVRLEQIESLLQTRFRSLETVYPGASVDLPTGASPLVGQYLYRDHKSYAMFSVASAGLNALPYALFSARGLYVIPVAGTLVLLFLAQRLTRAVLSAGARSLLVLVLALTTPLAFYSLVFWDHTLVAMLTMLAIWLAIPAETAPTARGLAWAGFILGLGSWFRPEILLGLPALAGAILLVGTKPRWTPLIRLGAGAAIALAPLFLFNRLAYGVFLGPHVLVAGKLRYYGETLAAVLRQRLGWAKLLVAPPWPEALAALAALLLLLLAGRWAPLARRQRALTLSSIVLVFLAIAILRRQDLDLQTTLLATSPFLLLVMLPSPWPAEERRTEPNARRLSRFLTFFGALYVLLVFLAVLPDGGAQWGPRLLLPAVPPLVIAGFLRLAEWTRRPVSSLASVTLVAAALTLAAAGLVSELDGLRSIREANEESHGLVEAIVRSGQRVIVCSDPAIPSMLAPIFYRGYLVFRAETAERLGLLAGRLAGHGLHEFMLIHRFDQPVLTEPVEFAVPVEGSQQTFLKIYRAGVFRNLRDR
jgi:hypothetical protein